MQTAVQARKPGVRYSARCISVLMVSFLVMSGTAAAPADDEPEPHVVAYTDYNDPLIRINRAVFRFNEISYRYALIPAADAYQTVVPAPARRGVGNFFRNIKSPIDFTNHLVQGEPARAGNSVLRFLINSTVGVAGFFDPASHWFELPHERSTAGETFARYGADYGVYLVLPFIGASNLRDGSGMMIDSLLNPLRYVIDNPESMGIRVFGNFQEVTPFFDAYEDMQTESEDPYIYMRNLHLQGIQRDEEF